MQILGVAIALFLSGVRRRLSFRMPGGWPWIQLALCAWLFWAGLVASIRPVGPAFACLRMSFASLATLDPIAVAREGAPSWFRRLRPALDCVGVAALQWLS